MTHREMLERMDSRELTYWQAFYQIEHDRATGKKEPETVADQIKSGMMNLRNF